MIMTKDLSEKYAALEHDDEFAAPPSNWFKFGKVGNVIRGTLVGVQERDDAYDPTKKQKVYEIKAELGYFNDIVKKEVQEEATELTPDEVYLIGGKTIIDRNMRHAVVGQRVELRYTGDFDVGGGNVAKTVEVKLGSMDPAYSAE